MERKASRYVLSAGIIPIYRVADGEDLYLLLRCYNYWDFPKGGVNRGEDPLEGALRELREETTLDRADFPWGTDFRETAPYAQGKVARYYIGQVHRLDVSLPVNPLLGRPEHHEFRWLTYADARPLLHERVKRMMDWAREVTRSTSNKV